MYNDINIFDGVMSMTVGVTKEMSNVALELIEERKDFIMAGYNIYLRINLILTAILP